MAEGQGLASEILHHVMEKVITNSNNDQSSNAPPISNDLRKFHVSQTADQLPDPKLRAALYREELESQIAIKRKEQLRRKELEALEEEKLLRKIETDRQKLQREYFEEVDKRSKTQEEARRRQQIVAQRLEELQIEEARKRDEEAAKKKRMLLESLYFKDFSEPKSTLSSYYFRRPWNSRDYVYNGHPLPSRSPGLGPSTDPIDYRLHVYYQTAPLRQLAQVYRNLEAEKVRLRDIMRVRIEQGEEE